MGIISKLFRFIVSAPGKRKKPSVIQKPQTRPSASLSTVTLKATRPIVSKERTGNTLIETTTYADGRSTAVFKHVPPKVNGVPTYELAATSKDDIQVMLKCCNAEMKRYKSSGEPPAPYCFWRLAVLAKKLKDYALEVNVCETYLTVTEELRARPDFDPRFPGITASPRTDDLRKRLPKARAMLANTK